MTIINYLEIYEMLLAFTYLLCVLCSWLNLLENNILTTT